MDPDTAADVIAVVFTKALEAGMNPDLSEFAVKVSPEGDMAVHAVGGDGAAFDIVVPAQEVADAMGMEPAPDDGAAPAQQSAPAQQPAQ